MSTQTQMDRIGHQIERLNEKRERLRAKWRNEIAALLQLAEVDTLSRELLIGAVLEAGDLVARNDPRVTELEERGRSFLRRTKSSGRKRRPKSPTRGSAAEATPRATHEDTTSDAQGES